MKLQDIYDFMDRFDKSSMSEIQLEIDNTKIICKKGNVSYSNSNKIIVEDTDSQQIMQSEVSDIEEDTLRNDEVCVRAKVAGTFYRAESPDSTPFVQVGQQVKKGDVLGMIEAMKMMNNITSPIDGEVVKIVKANEDLVGYDDILMILKSQN